MDIRSGVNPPQPTPPPAARPGLRKRASPPGRRLSKPVRQNSAWSRLSSSLGLIPFSKRSGPSFVVWMIAGMVFLAVIFAAGTMMVVGSMGRWQSDLAGSATVQIMPNVDLPTNQQREQINRDSAEMVNLLRQIKGIQQVEPISESRNRDLLAPFLGSIDLGELPMPRLISVTLDPRQVRTDTLRALVVQKNPTARYESHLDWLSGLVSLAHGLVFLGSMILILVFALALVTVMIVTRSNLNIHLDIIEVMHFMGADEKFIARSFVWHSFSLSFLGALFGGIFAAITIWLIGLIGLGEQSPGAAGFATDLSSSLYLDLWDWFWLLVLCLLMVVLCTLTAWRTSITAIRKLP